MDERLEITSREAAELLNVKITTIQKYVREKRLVPSNEASWHIDNKKYFYEDEVLQLKKELAKPGYTTGEIAKMLKLHPVTVSQYVSKGVLKAEKHIYRGRELSFISPEEYERFSNEYLEKKRAEKKEFYDKDLGIAWFQSFTNSNGVIGRILLEDNTPILITSRGSKIDITEIESNGFSPRTNIVDHGYSSKKGYARFEFPYEEDIESSIYDFIEICYNQLGPKNLRLGLEDSNIIFEIKPYLFSNEVLTKEIYNLLNIHIEEGSLTQTRKGLFIDSDYEILTFTLPSLLKQKVKQAAEENNISMEEYLHKIVTCYFEE
ncbi:helix-turn-helix domain-containing protein [Bacillales bacterium AN1005]